MIPYIDSFSRNNSKIINKPNQIRTQLLLITHNELHNHILKTKTKLNTKSTQEILSQCEQYEVIEQSSLISGNGEDQLAEFCLSNQSKCQLSNKTQKLKQLKSPTVTSNNNNNNNQSSVSSMKTDSDSNCNSNSILTSFNKKTQIRHNKIDAMITLRLISAELILQPLDDKSLMRKIKKPGSEIINEENSIKQIKKMLSSSKRKSLFSQSDKSIISNKDELGFISNRHQVKTNCTYPFKLARRLNSGLY